MPILAYLGAPRSGKSYSVVENNIIPALKQGRHVVTNIPVEKELLEQVFGGKITQLVKEDVLDPDLPDRIPNGVVLVLDEIWRRWPSGQKVNKVSLKDLELLKEHGHKVDAQGKTMQVVLVTQNAADLALWVRDLVKFSFVHEKMDALGLEKRFTIKIYRGCPTGKTIPDKLKVREAISTYKPEIYQFYKSATQSESEDLNVGDEQVMDKRASIWASWQMIAILIFVPFGLLTGGFLAYNYFASKLAPSKEVPEIVQEASQKPAKPVTPPMTNPWPEDMLPAAQSPVPVQGRAQQVAFKPEAPRDPPLSGLWRIGGPIYRSKEPRDTVWQSVGGYNAQDIADPQSSDRWGPDQVLLVSMFGSRRVTMDQCHHYPDGVQLYCDVDGERVTAWSGQQATSSIAPNVGNPGGGVAPSGERSDPSGATPAVQASRQPVRVTVVEDTSRTPRTLTASPESNQPQGASL